MSFQAMTWAVEQELKTNEKMALVMLSNCCNHHTGQCNPSHKRLAKECGMSISTLKRCIERLEEGGYLKIEHRGQEGVSLPNQYHLNIGFTPEVKPQQVDSSCDNAVQSDLGVVQSDLGVAHTDLGGWVQSDLGVGSERATKQEYNQEYNKQEYNQENNHTDAEKSASVVIDPSLPTVLPKQQQQQQDQNAPNGELPSWVPVESWAAFVEMRKAMGVRGKLTMNAAKLIVKKLEDLKNQGHDPQQVLDQSTMNNWKGVFPLKQQFSGRQQALEDRNRAATDQFMNAEGW